MNEILRWGKKEKNKKFNKLWRKNKWKESWILKNWRRKDRKGDGMNSGNEGKNDWKEIIRKVFSGIRLWRKKRMKLYYGRRYRYGKSKGIWGGGLGKRIWRFSNEEGYIKDENWEVDGKEGNCDVRCNGKK